MDEELTEWVSLMLDLKVFQSYSSIVSPNEPTAVREIG